MTILSSSNQQQQQQAIGRELALEFWSDIEENDMGQKPFWQSLPVRLHRLTTRCMTHQDDRLPKPFCQVVTAAILAQQPKPLLLLSSLEAWCIADLTDQCRILDDEGSSRIVPKEAASNVFWQDLRRWRWLDDAWCAASLGHAVRIVIMHHVRTTIRGNYDDNDDISYAAMVAWAEQHVRPWCLATYMGSSMDALPLLVADCYWSVRLPELFDLITSYPDSRPAVVELQGVLAVLMEQNEEDDDKRIPELSQSLRDSFVRRLNHPGADTTQLINVYIAAIQVLRLLLSSISLHPRQTCLAYTTEPVRSYLRRARNDTVRCILQSLTNHPASSSSSNPTTVPEGSSSTHVLYQELHRQDTKPLEYSVGDDDEEEECPTMDWQPRPSIHSYAHHQQQQHRSGSRGGTSQDADILAMLVGIYGSKELFVNEYRSMLADKLLTNLEYNTDNDVHTLELLKLRFGEMSLINAEVMIKDIEDSARLNKNVRDAALAQTATVVVDAAVVSHIFWPKLQSSQGSLKHHPRIQVLLDEYAAIYAEQKNPRTLHWLHHLGSLQMELEVLEEEEETGTTTTTRRETKEFTCSPFQATLISHFEDEPIWSADQLSNETNVPDHIIVKHMAFWIKQRVVTQLPTSGVPSAHRGTYAPLTRVVYALASAQNPHPPPHNNAFPMMMMDPEDDATRSGFQQLAVSSLSSSEEHRNRQQKCASFILILLTNVPDASIHNIHELLPSDAVSLTELQAILQQLCRQNKLHCGPDGRYRLLQRG